jgi:L-lactate dehydrogenase complex protein LldG
MVGVARGGRGAVSEAREDVLGRIRGAIGQPASGRGQDYETVPRLYRQAGTLDLEARLELFRSRIEHYECGCFRCTRDQLPDAIGRALTARGKRRLILPAGLPAEWLPAAFEFVRDAGLSYAELDGCDGAITGCTIAIAQTGSIVLCHDELEGRRALTLIPDYHLCVIRAEQVVETVPEGLRHPRVAGSALVTTISGPSATADIEMTRIKGVHGPRTLDVVLVNSPVT